MNICVIAYVGAAIHQPFLFVFLGLKDIEKATCHVTKQLESGKSSVLKLLSCSKALTPKTPSNDVK